MKPIKFKESNAVYAKDQTEYLPLHSHKTKEGIVISCWQMTIRERIKALITGRVWLFTHTFNSPLQPQSMQIDRPFTVQKQETK